MEVRRSDYVVYLPHNTETGIVALIEDADVAAEVAKRMIAAAVPVDLEEVD